MLYYIILYYLSYSNEKSNDNFPRNRQETGSTMFFVLFYRCFTANVMEKVVQIRKLTLSLTMQ